MQDRRHRDRGSAGPQTRAQERQPPAAWSRRTKTAAPAQRSHAGREPDVTRPGSKEPRCPRRSRRRALPQPDKTGHQIRAADVAQIGARRSPRRGSPRLPGSGRPSLRGDRPPDVLRRPFGPSRAGPARLKCGTTNGRCRSRRAGGLSQSRVGGIATIETGAAARSSSDRERVRSESDEPAVGRQPRARTVGREEAPHKPPLPGCLDGMGVVVGSDPGGRVASRHAAELRNARQRGSGAALAAATGDFDASPGRGAVIGLCKGQAGVVAVTGQPEVTPADPSTRGTAAQPVRRAGAAPTPGVGRDTPRA